MEHICHVCQRPKADLCCGLCARTVCKKCSQKVRPDTFPFLNPRPEELSHRLYCGICFDEKVAPALEAYEREANLARNVIVYYRKQGEETRFMKRKEKPLKVEGLSDRSDALMQLAYQAVRAGFNSLIDVEITSEKKRDAGYQTTLWKGIGVPTQLDEAKLPKNY